MADEVPLGRRFSHLYMVPAEKLPDSMLMRKRVHRTLSRFCNDHDGIGIYLESEMGIDLVRMGSYQSYVHWPYFEKCEIAHLLDAITLIAKVPIIAKTGKLQAYLNQISRIFREEHVAYRLDERGGVHPMVDVAHIAALDAAIRHLDGAKFSAARAHIERADLSLLPGHNTRHSVLAIFDAAENVFKQTFEGAISLNKDSINNRLKPALKRLYVEGAPLRAAQKLADALQDWADGSHNYRHEEGQPDLVMPPEPLVVVALTQGLGFVRWLADINRELDKMS